MAEPNRIEAEYFFGQRISEMDRFQLVRVINSLVWQIEEERRMHSRIVAAIPSVPRPGPYAEILQMLAFVVGICVATISVLGFARWVM